MSRIITSAALGLAAILTLAGPAGAATPSANDRVVVIVKATEPELHSLSGAKALALRIRTAATEACGGSVYPNAVIFSTGFRQCREAAIDGAIRNLDSPYLADALGRAPQVLARR